MRTSSFLLLLLTLAVGLGSCGDNVTPAGSGLDAPSDDADPGDGDAAIDDGDPGDGALDDGALDDGAASDGALVDALPGDGGTTSPDAGTGVTCGTMTCGTGQVCCVTLGGSTCVATGTCTGQPIACDGPEDCTTAGEVCCAGLGGVACAAQATCTSQVCRVDGDCDSGDECCGVLTGPRVCRNFCPGPP